MELDRRACDRARRSRDRRFDGRFFIAVTSTGIYCRPVCPVRAPKDENIRYFPSAAAAEAAGFRPCLRCRPEASPGTPAWNGTSGIVSRALRLISEGALDDEGVERLADRVGVTGRHLRRLFRRHLGATPLEVALTRRMHFAKKLLDETRLPIDEIAFASGFGSLRQFHAQIQRTFRRTPTELRRRARHAASDAGCYRFRLAFRPPYDWDTMLRFLSTRAVRRVESVDETSYRRTIALHGTCGVIEVRLLDAETSLGLSVRFPEPQALLFIVERVRLLFDLGADPAVVSEHLGEDPLLGQQLARHAGIRVPGAWDRLEIAATAILGPSLAGRVAATFGAPVSGFGEGLSRLFPTAARLASSRIEEAGVSAPLAETMRRLARSTERGDLASTLKDARGFEGRISEYFAMRALGEPDAFPHVEPAVIRRAEKWRPWRAYAFMLLSQGASEEWNVSAKRSRARSGTGRWDAVRVHGTR